MELTSHLLRAAAFGTMKSSENELAEQLIEQTGDNSKRTARGVLTGMCYSVGSVMRQGSSSLSRLTGQSASGLVFC